MVFTLEVLLIALLASSIAWGQEDDEGVGGITVKPAFMISLDDQGRKFSFPTAAYFDETTKETYILNNGKGRIVVYGPEFFPLVSLGAGRGVNAPNGMIVDKTGQLYVCQRPTATEPSRLTILNAAFFKEKEFPIQGFKEAGTFLPRRMVIGENNNFYIAADHPGILILDSNGEYLRHLTPMDRVLMGPLDSSLDLQNSTEAPSIPEDKSLSAISNDLGLPPELIPEAKGRKTDEESPFSLGPVHIIEVARDKAGNLYLLSQETSKVYVYDAQEKFLFSFGEKGGSAGKMSQPRGLALDENKKVIYVVDYMRHTILAHNLADGKFLFEFGGKGWSPGWFQYPTSVAVDHKGRVIVADTFNHRVQVLEVRFKVEAAEKPLQLPSSRIPSPPPSSK